MRIDIIPEYFQPLNLWERSFSYVQASQHPFDFIGNVKLIEIFFLVFFVLFFFLCFRFSSSNTSLRRFFVFVFSSFLSIKMMIRFERRHRLNFRLCDSIVYNRYIIVVPSWFDLIPKINLLQYNMRWHFESDL